MPISSEPLRILPSVETTVISCFLHTNHLTSKAHSQQIYMTMTQGFSLNRNRSAPMENTMARSVTDEARVGPSEMGVLSALGGSRGKSVQGLKSRWRKESVLYQPISNEPLTTREIFNFKSTFSSDWYRLHVRVFFLQETFTTDENKRCSFHYRPSDLRGIPLINQ